MVCNTSRTRRGLLAAAGLAALPAVVRPAAMAGPWVLVEGGDALLQLHAETWLAARRVSLPRRWSGLWPAGDEPIGLAEGGRLQRIGAAPGPVVTAAVATSADGRWICAVEGDRLQLRDAALAPVRHWPLPAPVAWLMDLPRRRVFVLAFTTLAQLWQLSYDEQAEDFYDGLVHDYRLGEGVPTRAFHNVRRMALPQTLLDASADGANAELAGRGWVFNLDVRRRLREQPLLQPPGPGCGAPCVIDGRRALAMPVRGEPRLDLYRGSDWDRAASIALPRPADAVLSHPAAPMLAVQLGGRLMLVRPAGDEAVAVAGVEQVRGRPRWSDDGRDLWVLTAEAVVVVDARSGERRRGYPVERPLALV